MSEGGDTLHLDRVHLLEGVVEDSGSVDNLPAEVLVVHVADEKTLGREGVGLDIDVGAGDLVDKRRLADVGVAADEEGTGGRVDGRETGHVLANLLEVGEGILLATHDGGHSDEGLRQLTAQYPAHPEREYVPSKGGLLELLASVETVSKLEQAAVILADRDDQVASSVELSKGELVVVLVVEDVEEGGKEGVEVLQTRVRQLPLLLHSWVLVLTSMMGNSVRICSRRSSNDCCVNLT